VVLCVFLMSLDLSDFVSRCFRFAVQICPSVFSPAPDLVPHVESFSGGICFSRDKVVVSSVGFVSRFVAACGALRSDLGLRYVSFAECAIRRPSSGHSPAWAGLSFPIFRSSALLSVPILDSSPVCFSVRNPTAVVLCWIFPRSACWISFLRPLL
jgi:hypothetical protein